MIPHSAYRLYFTYYYIFIFTEIHLIPNTDIYWKVGTVPLDKRKS